MFIWEQFRVKHMDNNLDPWYITGFVDGEGCFTFSRSGAHISLYFAIKLNDKDKPLLEKIQQYFGGVGKIYNVKPQLPSRYSGHTKSQSYYRVTKLYELKSILSHFEKYPLNGRKYYFYQVWRDMLSIKLKERRIR